MSKATPKLVLAKVESSNVESVGYCKESNMLGVRFKNNSLYVYSGVPETVYEEFVAAPSVGAFLNTDIRNKYLYTQVDLTPAP